MANMANNIPISPYGTAHIRIRLSADMKINTCLALARLLHPTVKWTKTALVEHLATTHLAELEREALARGIDLSHLVPVRK
jgi:hypothetical protein